MSGKTGRGVTTGATSLGGGDRASPEFIRGRNRSPTEPANQADRADHVAEGTETDRSAVRISGVAIVQCIASGLDPADRGRGPVLRLDPLGWVPPKFGELGKRKHRRRDR